MPAPYALEKTMTRRAGELVEGDESLWHDASILSARETKDAKIHVTLRLDPAVYRAVLSEKRREKDRTITATIERLLKRGLDAAMSASPDVLDTYFDYVRNLAMHSAAQDALIECILAHLKPQSKRDKALIVQFQRSRLVSEKLFSPLWKAKSGQSRPEPSGPARARRVTR
ncbi:MAG TPA: hypothetical protein VMD91_14120 [Candidatus Sulfotelmatobacter sp.]|nr:hypothetical protein [Candidatus Sulfotelmatobacter sp.]